MEIFFSSLCYFTCLSASVGESMEVDASTSVLGRGGNSGTPPLDRRDREG